MIRAVLDTNVIASAVVGEGRPENRPAAWLERWRAGQFALVTSEPLQAELARTLAKPYFWQRVAADRRTWILAEVRARGVFVEPLPWIATVATHPEDDVVVATAVGGLADFVVTGDRALLGLGDHGRFRFVTIAEYVAILAEAVPT